MSIMKNNLFVYNLYDLLESPENTDIFAWGEDGESLLIINLNTLSPLFLKHYFNLADASLFVKTLCAHGFCRQKSTPKIIERYGNDILEFKHRYFKRNRPDLLQNIKPKLNLKSALVGFPGNRHNNLDKTMDLQSQIIKAIAATSENLQAILGKLSVLKQEWMRVRCLEQFKSPQAIVLENDVCSRMLLISFLTKAGFDTYVAESGNDLVFRCERKSFDIIVMSFGILNILAVLRRVVAVKRKATVVLTYSNCDAGGGNFDDFRKMGVDEVLVKPYVEEQLITVIKRHA
eukprot:jgi/Antlo1/1148/850